MNEVNNYTINDVISRLEEIDDLCVGNKHSDGDVLAAEKALSVKLPNSFKEYLKYFGDLSFGSVEYYGLTSDNNFKDLGIPNFVWYTLKKRNDINLPENLIVLQNVNGELFYCLDVGTLDENHECKVVVWDNINQCIEYSTGIDFFAFLLGGIEEYIEIFQ